MGGGVVCGFFCIVNTAATVMKPSGTSPTKECGNPGGLQPLSNSVKKIFNFKGATLLGYLHPKNRLP